jgi:recombination protein RecA
MALSQAERARAKFEDQMAKTYGVDRFKVPGAPSPYTIRSTGSLMLDRALIVGGYVNGRMVELWGPEDGGKTTLVLITIADVQRREPDKYCAYIDMEGRLDLKWAQMLGVDLSRFYHVIPVNAEEVADLVKDSIRGGVCSVVALDSIGSMISKAEIDKAAGESTVANVPRVVTRMVNIAGVEAPKTGTAVLIINQVREKIGTTAKDSTTTPGGRALKHATTFKLKVSRTYESSIKAEVDGTLREIAHGISILVQRNKVGPSYRTAEVVLFTEPHPSYGNFVGLDVASEAVSIGVEMGIISQAGAWYSLVADSEFRAQGKQNMANMVRHRPDLIATIRQAFIDAQAALVVEELSFDPIDIADDLLDPDDDA